MSSSANVSASKFNDITKLLSLVSTVVAIFVVLFDPNPGLRRSVLSQNTKHIFHHGKINGQISWDTPQSKLFLHSF